MLTRERIQKAMMNRLVCAFAVPMQLTQVFLHRGPNILADSQRFISLSVRTKLLRLSDLPGNKKVPNQTVPRAV